MEDRRTEYDPSILLTRAALYFLGYLIVFISAIIGVQIWKSGEANTESWAALTGVVGFVTGIVAMIYNARYGTSKQSETKDAVIAQQSRTAEAIASGGSVQTTPIQSPNVSVAGENVTVTEAPK